MKEFLKNYLVQPVKHIMDNNGGGNGIEKARAEKITQFSDVAEEIIRNFGTFQNVLSLEEANIEKKNINKKMIEDIRKRLIDPIHYAKENKKFIPNLNNLMNELFKKYNSFEGSFKYIDTSNFVEPLNNKTKKRE